MIPITRKSFIAGLACMAAGALALPLSGCSDHSEQDEKAQELTRKYVEAFENDGARGFVNATELFTVAEMDVLDRALTSNEVKEATLAWLDGGLDVSKDAEFRAYIDRIAECEEGFDSRIRDAFRHYSAILEGPEAGEFIGDFMCGLIDSGWYGSFGLTCESLSKAMIHNTEARNRIDGYLDELDELPRPTSSGGADRMPSSGDWSFQAVADLLKASAMDGSKNQGTSPASSGTADPASGTITVSAPGSSSSSKTSSKGQKCMACNGTGILKEYDPRVSNEYEAAIYGYEYITCYICGGDGYV